MFVALASSSATASSASSASSPSSLVACSSASWFSVFAISSSVLFLTWTAASLPLSASVMVCLLACVDSRFFWASFRSVTNCSSSFVRSPRSTLSRERLSSSSTSIAAYDASFSSSSVTWASVVRSSALPDAIDSACEATVSRSRFRVSVLPAISVSRSWIRISCSVASTRRSAASVSALACECRKPSSCVFIASISLRPCSTSTSRADAVDAV
mmetsp:Transcript_8175/g.20884  ORF Transcript_8175/g.20884 Transcript_8175/m.20884 type:complete len:214 (-) Transcript_8175:971-1612(-)